MTWDEFKEKVIGFMTTEGTRLGVEHLRLGLIHSGARDLQQFVRRYQCGNQTILTPGDFTTNGAASIGELPTAGIKLKDCYVVRRITAEGLTGENVKRFPIRWDHPWDRRYEMAADDMAIQDQNAIGTIDPSNMRSFWVYPEITAAESIDGTPCDHYVELNWDGVMWDAYDDGDVVPFDEPAAMAVAFYAKGHLLLDTEPALASTALGLYRTHRLNLYLN